MTDQARGAGHTKGCQMCAGEAEPGWIETDNNGPIVRCICNPSESAKALSQILGDALAKAKGEA